MRRLVYVALSLAALVAMTAVAIAGEAGPSPTGQTQGLEVSHSPNKASKKKRGKRKAKKVGTRVTITLNLKKQDGTQPSPTTDAVVSLPKGLGLNYKRFVTCDINKLRANGPSGCPRKSKVGSGKLTAGAEPVIPSVQGTITAFNGKNKTYLLYVVPEISSPLVIPGKLKGSKLDFDVPLVPTLPGQPNATLTFFQVKTGGKTKKGKRTYNYLENPNKCSKKTGYPWKIAFKYENGESLTPTDSAKCKS
jgi:hypothetical protein